jgi:hypothetical protein
MDREEFLEDIYCWIGFMLTSAVALNTEPPDYGTIRLLDSTERLISILDKHGFADPFLLNMRQQLKEEKEGSVNIARRKELLNKIILEYSDKLISLIDQE